MSTFQVQLSRVARKCLPAAVAALGLMLTVTTAKAGFTYVPVPEIAAHATLTGGNPVSGGSGGGEHFVSWQTGIPTIAQRSILEMNVEFLQLVGGGSPGVLGTILSAELTFDHIQSASPGSVWQLAGYEGDGVFNLLNDPKENSRVIGRLEGHQAGLSADVALDPGYLMETVGVVSHLGILISERTDGASGSFYGSHPNLTAEITFEHVYASDGVAWSGLPFGDWETNPSNWTGGQLPTSADHTFIQTSSNTTIAAPSASTTVQSLTLGGGAGNVTLILDPVERLTSLRMTTVYGNGTLDINGGLLVTDGLNLMQGADLQWNGGILFVVDDFFSVPTGVFVMDDPDPSALTIMSGAKMNKTDSGTVIGQSNRGRFLVTNGSRITGGYITLGEQASGEGRLDVEDPGTFLDLAALIIGPEGYGIATIEDGADADIRYLMVGKPLVGSTGNPLTGGDLVIRDAGTVVENDTLNVSATGTMEVSGGAVFNGDFMLVTGEQNDSPYIRFTGNGTSGSFSSNVFVGPNGATDSRGLLYIENGADFYAQSMILSFDTLTADSQNEAELHVTGAGTQMTVQDVFIISAYAGESYAQVSGGARVDVNGPTVLTLSPDAEATVLISGAGTQWRQHDDFGIAGGRNVNTDEPIDFGTAFVTVADGALLEVDDRLEVYLNGTLDLTGGTVRAAQMYNNRGGVFNMTGGKLQVGSFFGDLTNAGGTLTTAAMPGLTDVTGGYTQGDGGTLRVTLGGLLAGDTFDLFAVSGAANLDGVLEVVLDGGFVPGLGDTFEFLTAASVLGVFDAEAFPALPGGLTFDLSYGASSVTLTVIEGGGIEGDLNGDGFVGIIDLNLLLSHWNQNVTPGDPLLGDPSGDGFVGIQDLNLILGNWNAGTPPANNTNIPEPGTALIVGVAGAVLVRSRVVGVYSGQ